MMSSRHISSIAVIFSTLLVCAYVHFFSMVFMEGAHCPHQQSAHTECIATMSGFALSEGQQYVVAQFLVCLFVLYCFSQVRVIAYSQYQKERRDFFVELFRRGILNPKAP